jgi:hypothetical protein
MKPSAIYSKSGKGVQEASGKTSLLKRADRAVLSAIDGRATLAEVAQKVGKSFDAEFERLVTLLDREGFVREVATVAAASSPSRPVVAQAKAPAAKPAAPSGGADDLDFTSIMPAIKPGRAPAAAPKPDATAQQRAKEQEAALYKARQEAEARAQAERDRLRQETEAKARAEAEAKIRAETEKKLREEAEAKVKAEAEAKARAAREAALRLAAEARARAEAEAQAKLEAERKVREEAERRAREEAEKALREAEELRQRLEEERKAREAEEAERKAREEAERKAREEEERRRREEEDRRRREEDERRMREEIEAKAREAAERARREEEDRRLREKEEEARRAREAEQARAQQARELEEARGRASQRALEEDRARRAQDDTRTRQPVLPATPPEPRAAPTPLGAGSLDALMADLDSFSQREEDERQARDAADHKQREEKARRAQQEAERRALEQAARQELELQRAAEEARRREEEERRAQEEAQRRLREVEEQRRVQDEERRRRAQEALAARPKPVTVPAEEDILVTEADLGMDDVRRDEAAVARETRRAQREREREARQRSREARERAQAAAREAPVRYPKARRPIKWGRPLAIAFFGTLVVAVAALHVMPLPMAEYEAAASEALGRPVRVGSARLSLFTGVRLNLADVRVGDSVRIAQVHAYPRIGSLFDEKKAFRRIELHGAVVPQQGIGAAVAAKLRGRNFEVDRIVASNLRLAGPVALPAFEAEARVGADGTVRNLTLRGPESLDVKLAAAANGEVEFDVTAATLTVPFVPDLSLASFAMKGSANRQGMKIASWGGAALDGVLSGSASVRWSSAWQVDGALTVRGINAAIFAPALLSEGKAEGTGRFSMSGTDPARLHEAARMEGNFSMGKGALGSFDLSRLLQTGGRQYGGRTPFTEMTGHATYERGAVALRNIQMSAGALTAGASADIAPGGALNGRIVADVRTTLQPLRATLVIGGTVKEPQVRN